MPGGYDDGLIRCWVLGVHSTGQLRTVTVTENGELAIPPLQYHSEWLAHDTEISGGQSGPLRPTGRAACVITERFCVFQCRAL